MNYTPDSFTADYVGEPGQRTFYVQAVGDFGTKTYLVEKEQVALLAEKIREILIAADPADTIIATAPARDPALVLQEPLEPQWRVGAIGLGYDEGSEHVVVLLHEATAPEDDEMEVADLDEGEGFTLRRDQARSFVLHTLATVAEGRARCRLCGLPIDPDGHICPASNGHRPVA